MQSMEFEALLNFLDKQYSIKRDDAKEFIEQLEIRKSILDYRQSEHIFEEAIKRDYMNMPVLSTGGYNDRFLTFVSHVFNT